MIFPELLNYKSSNFLGRRLRLCQLPKANQSITHAIQRAHCNQQHSESEKCRGIQNRRCDIIILSGKRYPIISYPNRWACEIMLHGNLHKYLIWCPKFRSRRISGDSSSTQLITGTEDVNFEKVRCFTWKSYGWRWVGGRVRSDTCWLLWWTDRERYGGRRLNFGSSMCEIFEIAKIMMYMKF